MTRRTGHAVSSMHPHALHPTGQTPPSTVETLAGLLDTCGSETRFIPVVNSAVIVRHNTQDASRANFDGSTASTTDTGPGDLVMWNAQTLRDHLASSVKEQNDPQFAVLSDYSSHSNTARQRFIAVDVPCSAPSILNLPKNERPTPLRRTTGLLCPSHAELAAQAKCAIEWHNSYRFCGFCGHPTAVSGERALARRCSNTECPGSTGRTYPRINPSVIVLVTRNHGSECLLGRQASWPRKKFSALAGFCELGESLENTVVREVREESGVIIDPASIQYHSSQAWPYPSASVLSGFYASALDSTIRLHDDELECAMWVGRDWLRAEIEQEHRAPKISIPGPTSLARALILDWVGQAKHCRNIAHGSC